MYQGHEFMAKYAGYSELGDISELDVHKMMARGRREQSREIGRLTRLLVEKLRGLFGHKHTTAAQTMRTVRKAG